MEISASDDDSPQYEGGGIKKQKSTSSDKKIGSDKGKLKNNSMTGSQKMENSADGSAAPANKSQARQKKPLKRIQRYESNSIDEEEFQDYFTNPIKRKEFDRQRKKQQMREMQNITGFTLGNFGIKSAKAMKEAMPPYPENDEINVNSEQKNYATVSLCCLSVTNPFRNKIIQIVAVNPNFDRFILVVIVVNCVFLALDQENKLVSDNSNNIDLGFLIIYTGEMILKIIAMGFFMRAHSYLRDAWNILDFMVVILGWFAIIFENSGDISAIKVIRILRPLRTINQIPNMSSLVATILNSLPIMFDVMILFFFMLIMFGTIATQLLGGTLINRCFATDEAGDLSMELGIDRIEIICQATIDCTEQMGDVPGLPPDTNVTCQKYQNPIQETYQFDNILMSILNIFQIITLEGWTDMMYIVRDAQRSKGYDPFFILIVILGSFVILNLMIAVQAAYLDAEFNDEAARIAEVQEKLDLKKKMQQQADENDEDEEEEEEEEVSESEIDGKPGRRKSAKKEKTKGDWCNKPAWFVKLSDKLEVLAEKQWFERSIIALIMFNTLSLSSEYYNQSETVTKVQEYANYFFTGIFGVEMIIKMVGFGLKKYAQDNFNIFDCFIVCMSYVELVMPDSDSSLSVLRAFRLLRIFKIIKSWDSLRLLLSTVLDSLQAITNLGVLIILFLFISALLTKQFYTGQLYTEDGEKSRYNFGTTGDALISVFIILTGENWNEIMVQVMAKEKSFSQAIFFCILMILGNFMLLNLFLAILLKSISEIGDNENAEAKEAKDKEEPEECSQENEDGSGGLNSSNSNIEEEFEQIKLQLMALSNNMNGLLDGNKDEDSNEEESINLSDSSMNSEQKKKQKEKKKAKEAKEKAKQAIFSSQQVIAMDQTKHDSDEVITGNSLFIFAPDNIIRRSFRTFISNSYFAGFIYHMIAFNSLLLTLDEPSLEDQYQRSTIEFMLVIISWIFIIECVVKVIVHGFYWGNKTYIKDPWNVLDFVIVIFSVLTMILVRIIDENSQGNIQFIRGFRALRALRPLRMVSKNEGIKTVVNSLILSIPALLNVLLIVILFLLVFGILGIQLFKGKMGYCNNDDPVIQWKYNDKFPPEQNCLNPDKTLYFTVDIKDEKDITIRTEKVEQKWILPFNRYDDIFVSMMTFFEIATLEMWPDMMYAAIDSTQIDHVPKLDNNKFVSLIFIIYIFFTTFFIMNLFISVIVDKFNEEIRKRQGADNFTDEQKEWVKIQRLLVHTNPKIIPVEPINCFRLQCFKIVQSQAFEYIIMTAIVINTVFLCIDYHGKSDELAEILENANWIFVIFFTGEMIIKITAYGIKYYWYVNWNKFDCIIVMMSLVALDERALEDLNFNVTALRIIRVSRLLRMVKTSEGLRTLLKTLFMSLGNILNTAGLLSLILFTFSVAGMSLFGALKNTPDGFISKNVNFRSFYDAMLTLWRAATGESWNGIMHDCVASVGIDGEKQGIGLVAICYWVMYQLMTFFIFMNVFIAVIGESFGDNQATEDENDILALKKKDIKAFQNTWAKYNPMGELYMRTIRLPDFLRELPPPLGYQGIRIEESKLNKIIFCLNIRDHHGRVYYPEVMWTIFHSIAGMNDDKVLNCEQITNILKLVKNKYKGLGKKVNLDSLCGNKYYRKELTAIKYIQAMKILYKWRNFKNVEQKRREQNAQNGIMDTRKPPTVSPVGTTPGVGSRYNKEAHPNNDAGNDSDREMKMRGPATNLGRKFFKDSEVSDSLEPSRREDEESKDLERQNFENQEHIKAQRLKNIKNGIERNRQEQAAINDGAVGRGGSRGQQQVRRDNINDSYDEEEDQEQRQGNQYDGQSISDDDAEMNGITERNAQSSRNKQQQIGRAQSGGAPKDRTRTSNRNRGDGQGNPGRSGKKANRYAANDYEYDSEEPVDHNQIKLQNKNRKR